MEHISVLLKEAVQDLNIKQNGLYVDCTLGGGGHAEAILKQLKNGHLFAFDQDKYAIERARLRLEPYQEKLTIIHDNFVNIKEVLSKRGITHVDGILYDLGVSSFHFDDDERGFSYQSDAPLDMRMDQSQSLTAHTIVNTYDAKTLKQILYTYAEETFAPNIVKAILEARDKAPIETTMQLVKIIKSALPQKVLRKKGHPAKKTFQALRIAVNDELRVFEDSLKKALDLLNTEGRIVVISFHSLEDRITKQVFKAASTVQHPQGLVTMPETTPDFSLVHRKVITPTESEIKDNRRAHSAKLRTLRKL